MALSLLHVYLSLCLSAIGLVVVQREEKHSERRRSQISGTVIERVHQVIGRDTPGYIDSNLLQSVAGDSVLEGRSGNSGNGHSHDERRAASFRSRCVA